MADKKSKSGNKPEQKFRVGGVTATLWKNTGDKGDYYTVDVERSYKDKEDEWQTTNSLRVNDLPKMVLACEQAYKYILLKEQEDK